MSDQVVEKNGNKTQRLAKKQTFGSVPLSKVMNAVAMKALNIRQSSVRPQHVHTQYTLTPGYKTR